ncbi:MAG: hypothetical protein DRR06_02785 [Gammaproteobacteria bacterium]|nr:MAG: hypothetical protein DRR06_02785 [Gammaproteobacteria bacterium]
MAKEDCVLRPESARSEFSTIDARYRAWLANDPATPLRIPPSLLAEEINGLLRKTACEQLKKAVQQGGL